jgi:hypothetical protein
MVLPIGSDKVDVPQFREGVKALCIPNVLEGRQGDLTDVKSCDALPANRIPGSRHSFARSSMNTRMEDAWENWTKIACRDFLVYAAIRRLPLIRSLGNL